jgi:condensin complex subunit 1
MLISLNRSFGELNRTAMNKLLDVLISGLNSQADAFAAELESPELEGLESFRKPLEMYSFLLFWIITSAETVATQKNATAAKETSRGKQSKAKQKTTSGSQNQAWDYTAQLQTAFDVICKILKLKLAKLWTLTSEKDTFVR